MEDLIPLFAIFFIFGLPVFGFIIVRALQHKERMEMIRRGILPPPGWKDWSRGAAAPMPPRSAPPSAPLAEDDPQRTLRKGVVLAFIGLALTIGLSFIGFLIEPGRFVPGPWLLGGLIPMFVGLAQVVTALMFGATFPAMQARQFGVGPGPSQASMPPPPPTFEGSYTYRPDVSGQELGQSRPPDLR
jgi:hypothetical protein